MGGGTGQGRLSYWMRPGISGWSWRGGKIFLRRHSSVRTVVMGEYLLRYLRRYRQMKCGSFSRHGNPRLSRAQVKGQLSSAPWKG
eukprot:8470268-Karenia_brevis.AAC.1